MPDLRTQESNKSSVSESRNTKKALINAGIHELHENGFSDFSMRRVAAACGISCAAPYRHFKDKNELILEIFKYINKKWHVTQNIILSEYQSERERLIEISVAYLRFLLENPDYFRILFIESESFSKEQRSAKAGISSLVKELITKYCQSVGMSEKDRIRKTYIVRSLIFGAVLMMHNGEIPEGEIGFDMVREAISREFDIK